MIVALLVVYGAASAAAFGGLVALAARGHRGARPLAAAVALPIAFGATVAAYAALVVFAQRCDEACDDGGPDAQHWWTTDSSWQWSAQFAVALIALVAALGLVIETFRGHYGRAVACFVTVAICVVTWIDFVAPLGDRFGV